MDNSRNGESFADDVSDRSPFPFLPTRRISSSSYFATYVQPVSRACVRRSENLAGTTNRPLSSMIVSCALVVVPKDRCTCTMDLPSSPRSRGEGT
ncbi:hypothetical protein X777_03422 [Ooceraea biroi]|uniref:Uncharacterized protein n=1 Tax=Ooceraea biroi TaxID=2015173 RepID=A0A026X270_OOCBI|nr:hypothetical protein X777_03422 [Ooceraea biroi]